jgi:hypothetical protein
VCGVTQFSLAALVEQFDGDDEFIEFQALIEISLGRQQYGDALAVRRERP